MLKRIPFKELLIVVFGAIVGAVATQHYERTQPRPEGLYVSFSHAYHQAIDDIKVDPPQKPRSFAGLSDEDWRVYSGQEKIEIGILADQLNRTRKGLNDKKDKWKLFTESYEELQKLLDGPRYEKAAQDFFNLWTFSDPTVFDIMADKWHRGTFNKQIDTSLKDLPIPGWLELKQNYSRWPGGWEVVNPRTHRAIIPKSKYEDINGYFAKSLARFDQVALRSMINEAIERDIWYTNKIEEALKDVEKLAIQYARIVVEIQIFNSGKAFSVLPTADLKIGSSLTAEGQPIVIPASVCSSEKGDLSELNCEGVIVPDRGFIKAYFVSNKLIKEISEEMPIAANEKTNVQISLEVEPPTGLFGGKGVNTTQDLPSRSIDQMWESTEIR